MSYLRSICSQAGVGCQETPIDEDVLAVDCIVAFKEGDLRVQVKCTSQYAVQGWPEVKWPVAEDWKAKWAVNLAPVYFVLVVVPKAPADWLIHDPGHTRHDTAAFWRRIEPQAYSGQTIVVPSTQRLTVDTLAVWHQEYLAAHGFKAPVSP